MGVGGQHHAPVALPPGKTRYPLYRRLGRPPGPVRTGAENLAPTGIRSPDRPARSESLYRLSYPGPIINLYCTKILKLFSSTPGVKGKFINIEISFAEGTLCLNFFFFVILTGPGGVL